MRRLEALPRCFDRFAAIGGVIEFAVFDEAGPGDDLAAIAAMLGLDAAAMDRLGELACRERDEAGLFGDWFDPATGKLIRRGAWTLDDGRRVVDPYLVDLQGAKAIAGGTELPEAGSGGELAFAFLHPPYDVHGEPRDIQAIFDGIRAFLLPAHFEHRILDWSSPRLPEVSPWFGAGMEWWGVYLFTIYTPAAARLVVIAASETD